MKRIVLNTLAFVMFFNIFACSDPPGPAPRTGSVDQQDVNQLYLRNYRPESIYKVQHTVIEKARYPVVDMHSHAYALSEGDIEQTLVNMDAVGIQKTIILTGATGTEFDSIYNAYAPYGDRFEVWCGFDYTGYNVPGYGPAAVAELERCYQVGATGVGELGDKGAGLVYCDPPATGMHLDDLRLDPLLEKCAELGLPINIHIAEPIWMYAAMDETNDGLMNAFTWRLGNQPNIVDHQGMIDILGNALKRHPQTTFIACHYANLSYDLQQLGRLLEDLPNLYVDNGARYAEVGPIPRATSAFYDQFQDRIFYGTDMGYDLDMYRLTLRQLETMDEHFYAFDQYGYHWALNGMGLSDEVLYKIYYKNAQKLFGLEESTPGSNAEERK